MSAIRKAVKSGTEVVLVAGGDGTLRAAARILAYHDKPLGIRPVGGEAHAEAGPTALAGTISPADLVLVRSGSLPPT